MKNIFILTVLFLNINIFAATVTKYSVYSAAMNKDIPVNVILPEGYDRSNAVYPVMYLYHGAGQNYTTWATEMPECIKEADRFQTIIVCPDAALSWYFDSPVELAIRYETFCAKELVEWTDANFRTIKTRKARAVCGLSMGGHGALWIGIRNRDTFGTVIALSGGVDIRPYPGRWGLDALLGKQVSNPENWNEYTVVKAAEVLRDGELAISIDCGSGDFFYQVNENLHNQLMAQEVRHDYIIRPGAHTAEYWNDAIVYAMAFADKQFVQTK